MRHKDRAELQAAQAGMPIPVPECPGVYHCGYHSVDSAGAASYIIVREQGNIMMDCPRFNPKLAKNIEAMGGISQIVLSHMCARGLAGRCHECCPTLQCSRITGVPAHRRPGKKGARVLVVVVWRTCTSIRQACQHLANCAFSQHAGGFVLPGSVAQQYHDHMTDNRRSSFSAAAETTSATMPSGQSTLECRGSCTRLRSHPTSLISRSR